MLVPSPFLQRDLEKIQLISLNLLPYLSRGVNSQRIIMRMERDDVCKPFHIWLGTEEAVNKNAGSLPFLYPRELFSFKEKNYCLSWLLELGCIC